MRRREVRGSGEVGLVGVGEGKDANAGGAVKKAFQNAVKNFDYVERFEGRTIATTVKGKFSSSTVTMRPRPPGECLGCDARRAVELRERRQAGWAASAVAELQPRQTSCSG